MSNYDQSEQQFEPQRRGSPPRQRFERDYEDQMFDEDDDRDQRRNQRRTTQSIQRAARSSLDAVTPMATLPSAIGVAAMEASLRAWREFSNASREVMRAQQDVMLSGLQSVSQEGERQQRQTRRFVQQQQQRAQRQYHDDDDDIEREERRFRGPPQNGGGREFYD